MDRRAALVITTRYERYAWASVVVLLVAALAIFSGVLLSLPFGFLALALIGSGIYSGWQLRRLNRRVRAEGRLDERLEEHGGAEGWRLSRSQNLLLSILCTAILVTLIFAGLSTPIVLLVFLGFLAVVMAVQFRRMRRWNAKKPPVP